MTSHPNSQICKCLVWAAAANCDGVGHQSKMTDVYFNIAVCMYTSCATTLLSGGNRPHNHFTPVMESNYALPPRGASNVSKGSALIGPRGSNDDVGTSDVMS